RRDEFQSILERALDNVIAELRARGVAAAGRAAVLQAAAAEDREASDYRVLPMHERLARIFALAPDHPLLDVLCARFLEPTFAIARVYDDAVPVLTQLREAGFRTAIVSNAPWGSPSPLWRREIERLGFASLVDSVVLCGEVGWRKPSPQIFHRAAA